MWGMRRVAVIDIDCHYGNGTEELVRHDEDAFFASVHMKHNDFFPSDECIGKDVMTDRIVSIGLKPGKMRFSAPAKADADAGASKSDAPYFAGSSGFRRALGQHVFPACRAFQPDLIFISAGFDGLATDPVGGDLGLSRDDYNWATMQIVEMANDVCAGRLVSVLEGGYDTNSPHGGLVGAVEGHVRMLMQKKEICK